MRSKGRAVAQVAPPPRATLDPARRRLVRPALTAGALVGLLSYFLLVISMIMRAMRVLVVISALVAIAYDVIWLKDPVRVF